MKQLCQWILSSLSSFFSASHFYQTRRLRLRPSHLRYRRRLPPQTIRSISVQRFSVESMLRKSRRSFDLPMAQSMAQRKLSANHPPQPEDMITYSVPRGEVVTMLNRRLTQADATSVASKQTEESLVKPIDRAYLAECRRHYKAAELLYFESLNLRRKQFGEHHPKTVVALSRLANLYCKQGRDDEAEPLLTRALATQAQIAKNSLVMGELSYQLARLHQRKERYAQADDLFQHASTIFRQQLGSQHPRTQAVYADLMAMLIQSIEIGKFEELNAGSTPLDLERLSEIYSWAQPPWKR